MYVSVCENWNGDPQSDFVTFTLCYKFTLYSLLILLITCRCHILNLSAAIQYSQTHFQKVQDYKIETLEIQIFTKSKAGNKIVIISQHYSQPNLLKMLSKACVYTHGRWLATWLMCICGICVCMLVPCSPSRLLHALHAVLLRSGRSVSPFRLPGPADLKCFQMCVGCDPFAPPPAPSPQAWAPSIRADSIPLGWVYA